MDDFTQLPAIGAVLDRARTCLGREDLPHLVMSDPGSLGYIAAYERVLAGGTPELLRDDGHLLDSFEIEENLLLSHSNASASPQHRWFSILTAAIELLSWNGWETARARPASRSLCHLATDSFALRDAGDVRAPLDLLPSLCREIRQASANRHLCAIALLCELIVDDPHDAEVDAKCRELTRSHEEFQPECVEDAATGEWLPNEWKAKRPDLIWGAVVGERQELRMWLALVTAHFPSSSELSRQTRERLVQDGAGAGRRGTS